MELLLQDTKSMNIFRLVENRFPDFLDLFHLVACLSILYWRLLSSAVLDSCRAAISMRAPVKDNSNDVIGREMTFGLKRDSGMILVKNRHIQRYLVINEKAINIMYSYTLLLTTLQSTDIGACQPMSKLLASENSRT